MALRSTKAVARGREGHDDAAATAQPRRTRETVTGLPARAARRETPDIPDQTALGAGLAEVIARLEAMALEIEPHAQGGILGHVHGVVAEAVDLLRALPVDRAPAAASDPDIISGGLAGWQVKAVSRYICDHLGTRMSIADLARTAGLSGSHFQRAFQKSFGTTPMRYVRRTRVCRAKRLLKDSAMPLVEIAERCGFADQAQFTRIFQEEEGTTPRRWRMSL